MMTRSKGNPSDKDPQSSEDAGTDTTGQTSTTTSGTTATTTSGEMNSDITKIIEKEGDAHPGGEMENAARDERPSYVNISTTTTGGNRVLGAWATGAASRTSVGRTPSVRTAVSERANFTSRSRRTQLQAEIATLEKEMELARRKLELNELADSDDGEDDIEEHHGAAVSTQLEDWVSRASHKPKQPPHGAAAPLTTTRHESRLLVEKAEQSEATSMGRVGTELVAAIRDAVTKHVRPNKPKYMVDLQTFNGDPSEWIAFRATYRDTEQYFSEIENVARLRKCIQGRAREAVRALLFYETNPKGVLETLERRFGRPRQLITHEIRTLERMAPLAEDSHNIGRFATTVANVVSTIEQLGKTSYLHSMEIEDKIVEKMNNNLKMRWVEWRCMYEDKPALLVMSRFLNRVADQFATCEIARRTTYEKTTRQNNRPQQNQRRAVHATYAEDSDYTEDSATEDDMTDEELSDCDSVDFVAAAQHSEPTNCPLCKESHHLKNCQQFRKLPIEDRWEVAKREHACFRCLSSRHRGFNCRARPCGKNGCKNGHHHLLHAERHDKRMQQRNPSKRTPRAQEPNPQNATSSAVNIVQSAPSVSDTAATTTSAHVNTLCSTKAYLKIAPIEITGPQGTFPAYALLDEGSTVTLIDQELAERTGASGPQERLNIEGISGGFSESSSCLKLQVRGRDMSEKEEMTAYTINKLRLSPQAVRREEIQHCEHLDGLIDNLTYSRVTPNVLIGQDNWHLIISREVKFGAKTQPVASLTKLGWILHGVNNIYARNGKRLVNHLYDACERDRATHELVKQHFAIESIGVAPKRQSNDPEQMALKILDEKSRRLPDGRFETGLLWKTSTESMPANRESALSRLHGIERKLKRDDKLRCEYTKQINNLLASGYAERIDTTPTSPRAWYLPHFAVVHPQKGKIRLVFDAAARTSGKCLNDALLSGPDLIQSLFGVLIRFRQKPVAVVADIKEMFLQVRIREEDRDSLRFLWRSSTDEPPSEYRMTSLIFGATSSPCTAIYIKNRNGHEHSATYPLAARAIERNHYVDDLLQSFDTADEAHEIVMQIDNIHRKAKFELRGWASNVPEVLRDIPHDSRAHGNVELSHAQEEKTLGLIWHVKQDVLNFSLTLRTTPQDVIRGTRAPTKREATSAVMSVFDPLGLAAPVLIQGKKMLQQIWRAGTDWDNPITPVEHALWTKWLQDLRKLQDLNIPRCLSHSATGELHIFCDASETAYAAAIYWRTVYPNGQINVRLITGKARVTPLKPVSIPRLELQAALLGSRLATSVAMETDYTITSRTYWTDANTVLAWIKSDPRTFKPYVAHRLAELEEHTQPDQWRWVPTKLNVADDATRNTPTNFDSTHRWFTGPEFLYREPAHWPAKKTVATPTKTGEEKSESLPVTVTTLSKDKLLNFDRFSNWKRLLRATARLLQVKDQFKNLIKQKQTVNVNKDATWRRISKKLHSSVKQKIPTPTSTSETRDKYLPLSNQYLHAAELLIIKQVQQESFHDDIERLKKGQAATTQSKLRRITTELRDNLLYLSTRISAARYLTAAYKKPLVLDSKHTVTRMLITYLHQEFGHGNHHIVMNEIRQRYFIFGLRSTVRSIAKKCVWCRSRKNIPPEAPQGDLPPERLQAMEHPFTFTGIDYFGPLIVTQGRSHVKRWGVLFTCLVTRAVHLEVATSLRTDSALLALRRLCARRGTPHTIISDNGTNLASASKELQEMQLSNIAAGARSKGINWKFIPPGSPHMGGAWERLIRSIKVALSATLHEQYPTDDVLHTLLLEAEHVVNSRPLIDIDLNPNEEEALTPNHFLIQRSNGAPPFDISEQAQLGTGLWRKSQELAQHFWQRWLREYLPILAPRPNIGRGYNNPERGDLVLIVDSSLPRSTWPRGEIVTVHTGPDGNARIVEVRTKAGIIRRPMSRIVVLVPSSDRAPD